MVIKIKGLIFNKWKLFTSVQSVILLPKPVG